MSEAISLSKEETAALESIDAALSRTSGTEGLDLGDLCKKYQAIRGPLELLIKIVKKIPGIGARVAAALEFLMGLADIACPV